MVCSLSRYLSLGCWGPVSGDGDKIGVTVEGGYSEQQGTFILNVIFWLGV